jgi:hypothetical protein
VRARCPWEYGLAVSVVADRLVGHVNVHRSRERVRHDERRRRQVARLHERMDAAFEVAIAGEHRDHIQVVSFTSCSISGVASGPEFPERTP